MTPGGWLIMILSVGFVTTLFIWCVWKVLATPEASKRVHDLGETDTGDLHD